MVSKWKNFRCVIVMAVILFVIFIGIELVILCLFFKYGIISGISEIQNFLWPLNAMISFITLTAGRLLKNNEQRINGDIKLIENFMKFFEIAHGRPLGKEIGESEQIAAIYAVAELGKRHSILRNIAEEGLISISLWSGKDPATEKTKEKAKHALEYLKNK